MNPPPPVIKNKSGKQPPPLFLPQMEGFVYTLMLPTFGQSRAFGPCCFVGGFVVIFFLLILFLVLAHYILFPGIIILLARLKKGPPPKELPQDAYPRVSLVICAFNEEGVIREKLLNSIALEYPKGKLEITVVADGSTDKTANIAAEFEQYGIRTLRSEIRMGKSAALNNGARVSTGDIIVFSDANAFYHQDALFFLVRHFSDPVVGAVTGRKTIRKSDRIRSGLGDSAFWKVESLIKASQSTLGSISTGDGEIFAVKRHLFQALPPRTINDDVAITLSLVQRGYRVLYEPLAICEEEASHTLSDEFRVKARIVCGGYQTLSSHLGEFLIPRRFFYVQFFMHKGLRHLMPFLLVSLFVSTLILGGTGGGLFALAQALFYLCAILTHYFKSLSRLKVCELVRYYCLMNIAALVGAYYFLSQPSLDTLWPKAER